MILARCRSSTAHLGVDRHVSDPGDTRNKRHSPEVCCYPLYEPLLRRALQLARTGFAMSYPRDRWFVRAGMWLENALRRRRGNPFRTFVHPPSEMMRIIEGAGFRLASRRRTPSWSCDVFVRT